MKLSTRFRPETLFRTILVLSVISFGGTNPVHAQLSNSETAIKIDPTTRVAPKIPFDRPFTLVLTPADPQNILKVFAYQLTAIDNARLADETTPLRNVQFRVDGANLIIDFPPVPPKFYFDFTIVRQLDSNKLDQLISFANFIAKAKQLAVAPATDVFDKENSYRVFTDQLEPHSVKDIHSRTAITSYGYDYLFQGPCLIDGITAAECATRSIEGFYDAKLANLYTTIFTASGAPLLADPGFSDDLREVSRLFRNEKLNDQTISTLIRIFTDNRQNDLYSGLITMNYNHQTKTIDPEDIKERSANFTGSYRQLTGLEDTLERLSNERYDNMAALTRAIDHLHNIVKNMGNAADKVTKSYATIKKLVQKDPGFTYTEWYVNNSTEFKTIQTKSAAIFSPQLGLSFLWVPKNEGGSQVIPKLTVGINVNFRAIDKDIRRTDIPNKSPAHYLSAFVGLTLSKFKDPQYDNLFASNSLLFGLNYRVNRSLYLSAGGTAFRQLSKNPVINDFHTQLGGYASILLDLDIVNAVSNITSTIFGIK